MDTGPLQHPQARAGTSATLETTPSDEFFLWHTLYRLEAAYWHDVDVNQGRNAHEFYTPDGILVVSHNRFQGCDEIRAFYRWRERQAVSSVSGATTTRHLISNLYLQSRSEGRAKVVGILSLYGGIIRRQAPQSKPPLLVADLCNECVQDQDGAWRFSSHVLQPVFMSHETALSMAIDTRSNRAWAAQCEPKER